jgi:hypothetical protein
MELKFIWAREYRVIKETGFNFNHSGKHQFAYQNDEIILSDNGKSKIDFGKKITGVTVIAGENGSGKSSLCEISLLTTATRVNGAFGYDIVFDGIVCYGDYIFYQKNLLIRNKKKLEKEGYLLRAFKETPFEEIDFEEKRAFAEGGFVYYSNVLDLRSDFSAMNLVNISSQNFVREDYKFSTSYPSINPYTFEPSDEYKYMDRQDPIQIYQLGQGYRSTKFYVNYPSLIPFTQPQTIILKSTYTGNNRWLRLGFIENYDIKRQYEKVEDQIFSIVYPHRQVSQSRADEEVKVDIEIVKRGIHELYKFNLIIAMGVQLGTPIAPSILVDFVFNERAEQIQSVQKLVQIHKALVDVSTTYDLNFNPFSVSHYYEKFEDWRHVLLDRIFIPNSAENRKLLKTFIELENSFLKGDHGTHIRISNYSLLPQLSSGESSFMNFFSRLHDVLERYKEGIDDRTTLILFIDEAEVGFHPEWSKKFFSWLHNFLNNYTSDFTFQLILTTHSPYLLSDLDSSNVLLLKKGTNGNTVIVPSTTYKTFGSNIHELLATSFFMNEGFMGEFAKSKIEQLVEYFEGGNQMFNEESSAEFIALIGDEVIASRLTDMHNDKFGKLNDLDLEQYETWLRHELDRIQLNK